MNHSIGRRRVVVTGIGCVTPLGSEVETVWKRLLAAESGVGKITLFDASNFPTKIAAEVRDLNNNYVTNCGALKLESDFVTFANREDGDGCYVSGVGADIVGNSLEIDQRKTVSL